MPRLSTAELKTKIVEEYIKKQKLGELSRSIKVSKAYLSAFANGKANWDTQELEAKLCAAFDQKRTSFRDERRTMAILEILHDCDDPQHVCQRITDEFI